MSAAEMIELRHLNFSKFLSFLRVFISLGGVGLESGFNFNAVVVSLVLIAFDDTGSLGYPPRRMVYLHGFHPE